MKIFHLNRDGIPFLILGALFVGLKVLGLVTWSWEFVTAPFWLPGLALLAITGLVVLSVMVLNIISFIISSFTGKK